MFTISASMPTAATLCGSKQTGTFKSFGKVKGP